MSRDLANGQYVTPQYIGQFPDFLVGFGRPRVGKRTNLGYIIGDTVNDLGVDASSEDLYVSLLQEHDKSHAENSGKGHDHIHEDPKEGYILKKGHKHVTLEARARLVYYKTSLLSVKQKRKLDDKIAIAQRNDHIKADQSLYDKALDNFFSRLADLPYFPGHVYAIELAGAVGSDIDRSYGHQLEWWKKYGEKIIPRILGGYHMVVTDEMQQTLYSLEQDRPKSLTQTQDDFYRLRAFLPSSVANRIITTEYGSKYMTFPLEGSLYKGPIFRSWHSLLRPVAVISDIEKGISHFDTLPIPFEEIVETAFDEVTAYKMEIESAISRECREQNGLEIQADQELQLSYSFQRRR